MVICISFSNLTQSFSSVISCNNCKFVVLQTHVKFFTNVAEPHPITQFAVKNKHNKSKRTNKAREAKAPPNETKSAFTQLVFVGKIYIPFRDDSCWVKEGV
jgi:hypothetical protein